MGKAAVTVTLKGMAALFNDAAQLRVCESEHYSPENSADLSDLVNSFIESENGTNNINHDQEIDTKHDELETFEKKNRLRNLLNNDIDEDDLIRRKIRDQAEIACGIIGESSPPGFKRRLMSHLRDQGFDAGLCKCQRGKFERRPPGEYEYVDVNVGGNRFIIEVYLAREFEIARPITAYTELLNIFPRIFIGKAEELKQVVRLMCSSMRMSMKEMELHVPPWRRNGYMQAKWFVPYKRTINEIPTKSTPKSDLSSFAAKRSIGFEAFPVMAYNCRDNYTRVGVKAGYLTAAFNDNLL